MKRIAHVIGKILIWSAISMSLSLLGFISASVFGSRLKLWENAILLVRNHVLNQPNMALKIYAELEKIISFIDKSINIIPSWIQLHWWDERLVYVYLNLPVIMVLSFFLILFRKRSAAVIGLILVFLWLIPVTSLTNSAWDYLVIKNHWDWKSPWSKEYIWMWPSGNEAGVFPYTSFRYRWNQINSPASANILISCLGDYQLLVNGESLYHGPSYAIPPRVYYDKIALDKHLKKGQNEILIICNYSNEKRHQHATYSHPDLLIGGKIKDGIFSRNLADNRLWESAGNKEWRNGEKISADAGYSENLDLSKESENIWKIPSKRDEKDFVPEQRQTPLLIEKEENIVEIAPDIYDLGRTSVGYLTAVGNTAQNCTLSVMWGDKLISRYKVQDTTQNDSVIFAAGPINWEQFSRRSGRYIQLSKLGCDQGIKIGFKSVGMPYVEPQLPPIDQEVDKQIFQLSLNTLKNNVQDHFEDSVIREKAMYVGDAREISQCLMVDDHNMTLVQQMIRQFSQSQNKDGSLPAMAPSGNPLIIYDYVPQ